MTKMVQLAAIQEAAGEEMIWVSSAGSRSVVISNTTRINAKA
jgi:hypothetical protein